MPMNEKDINPNDMLLTILEQKHLIMRKFMGNLAEFMVDQKIGSYETIKEFNQDGDINAKIKALLQKNKAYVDQCLNIWVIPNEIKAEITNELHNDTNVRNIARYIRIEPQLASLVFRNVDNVAEDIEALRKYQINDYYIADINVYNQLANHVEQQIIKSATN